MAIAAFNAAPALADGGAGSAGLFFGGIGGQDNAVLPGGTGGPAVQHDGGGGGGGGAGITGGNGGIGSEGTAGGLGGSSLGADGQNGAAATAQEGGTGGGGGAHGFVGAQLLPTSNVTGGRGGSGGNGIGGNITVDGGGGGGGGYGAVIIGTANRGVLNSEITGGRGGDGGANAHIGGNGGTGGIGLFFTSPGNSIRIGSSGSVQGGQGGLLGTGTDNGIGGSGGAGIVGSNLTIINGGMIAGGFNGSTGRADAIDLSGSNNRLELWAGSNIRGNVVVAPGGTNNVLALGGPVYSLFDVSLLGDTGQYRGFNSFEKTGLSTFVLFGTATSTNPWSIDEGTVALSGGSLASSSLVTVNSGATVTGTGTLGNTLINSGGIFIPGTGFAGSFTTVQGSLAFQSGAQYVVQVSPMVTSYAVVTGTATLGGATVSAGFLPGSYVEKTYTILSATGGVSGTFAGPVNTNLPANFNSSLSYDATNAYLDLTLNYAPVGPNFGSGLNGNQQAVANTLVNFFNSTGGIPMTFGALSPQGLTQASGELATGSQQATFDAMNMFMGVMTDPFMAGRGEGFNPPNGGASQYTDESHALSYTANGKRRSTSERDAYAAIYTKAPPPLATFEQRWSVWGAGYGGSQTTTGNSATGSNNTTGSIYGGAAGADYHLSRDTVIGFALAGGGTNFSVANSGTARSDLFQAGAFARHEMGPAYITAAFAYGWQNITTDRTVTAAGVDRLHASFDANAYSGRVESGWRFVSPIFGGLGLTPYAAGQVTLFDLPSYAEQALSGANTFALSYAAKDVTATRSELGLRVDKSFAISDAVLMLRGRAAWAHNFDPDRSIGATFQTLPGASFVVNGAAQASDSALITASAESKWVNGWSVAGTFEGEFSSVTNSYAGKGVVRYAW